MKLKSAVLSLMTRDMLKMALDELEIEDTDRRSVEEMRSRLSRSRLATPEVLIGYLGEAEVKEVCDLVGIPSRGRRNALIETLLTEEETPPPSKPPSGKRARPSNHQGAREEPELPDSDEAEQAIEDEPVRWMRPEEARVSDQPTEKPVAVQPKPQAQPFSITRTELVWPGKYDGSGNPAEPPRISLPFQVVEVIEEGRSSREALKQLALPLFGEKPKGPTDDGWRNKLIWGDNIHVLGSLTDYVGKVDLIYIDPPFDTGSDFSYKVLVGDSDDPLPGKDRSSMEEVAYRDTWGKGPDSYLQMMRNRLILLRDLLSETGSIFVHLDVHTGPYIKILF